jgi:hypothetical protein
LSAGRQAVTTGAGIVDSLPVGGGMGAVSDVATRAARAAVLEATASPMGSALTQGAAFAGNAMSAATGAFGSATSAVSDVAEAAGDAMSTATEIAGGVANAVGGSPAGAAKVPLDPDQVVEIVERRLLREIERRGGRWAGVF